MRPIDVDAKVKHFRKLADESSERERNECDITNKAYCRGRALAFATAADLIDIAPTLDVQPVVHAEWVFYGRDTAYTRFYRCSCCNYEIPVYEDAETNLYKYCPDCGAKMDKGD